MPWWCSGYALVPEGDKESAIIICYLPIGADLYDYWDDAFNVVEDEVDRINYSSRFPKPEWIKDKE